MKLLEDLKMQITVRNRVRYYADLLGLLERNDSAVILDLGGGAEWRVSRRIMNAIGASSYRNVDLDTGHDLEDGLSEPDNVADVVIASQIIEHLRNTDQFVKEIRRVLKPHGYAIISTPNLASWWSIIYLLLGRQPEAAQVSEDMYPEKERPGHLRIFTRTELLKLLTFHGLQIEKVVGGKHATYTTVKVRK